MPELESLQLGFLVLARVTAFMFVAPFFSIKGPPGFAKVGLGVFLTILVFPGMQAVGEIPADLAAYSLLVIKEVIVGLIIGFASMLTFTAVRVAGELIDIHMGFGMAAIFDPQNQARITLIGQFMFLLQILLFLAIDGHHTLLLAISYSFKLIPVAGFVVKTTFITAIVKIFIGMFALGVKIAIPFIAVFLISDIGLGILARTVPQLNVFILGFPIKAGLGLITLIIALPLLTVIIGNVFRQMNKDIVLIMELMK